MLAESYYTAGQFALIRARFSGSRSPAQQEFS